MTLPEAMFRRNPDQYLLRFDTGGDYTVIFSVHRRTWLDEKKWERGPARTFELRIPIVGNWIFRFSWVLTRWL